MSVLLERFLESFQIRGSTLKLSVATINRTLMYEFTGVRVNCRDKNSHNFMHYGENDFAYVMWNKETKYSIHQLNHRPEL